MDKAFEIEAGVVAQVPLSLVDCDPNQPRTDFDDGSLYELADDIKKVGVQQPITVRPNEQAPGRFFIVYGERRYRASKLARKKTIPSLLYTGKQGSKNDEGTSLDVLLNQVKENHLRKDLNAMEWAKTFHVMNKIHGLKQAEIEATLKDHAVGNFGRAYISNILRLLELPEWAQDMIRSGKLTAAHGKHLLPAMASEKVMISLKESFADKEYSPTTKDLARDIFIAFSREHAPLTGWRTDFDYKEKCVATGCQKMRKISHPDSGEDTFCLDRGCYAKFNAEAQAEAHDEWEQEATSSDRREHAASDKQKDYKVNADNQVNVDDDQLEMWDDYVSLAEQDFDISTCEGCPHRHMAVSLEDGEELKEDSCFETTCLGEKQRLGNIAARLAREHIREVVSTRVSIDPALCNLTLLWVAALAPSGKSASIHDEGEEYINYSHEELEEDEDLDNILIKANLCTLADFFTDGRVNDDTLAELAEYYLRHAHHVDLVQFGKVLNVTADSYRINERWLAEHTIEDIEDFVYKLPLPPGLFANLELAEGEAFDKLLLDSADKIGIPPAIKFAVDNLLNDDKGDD